MTMREIKFRFWNGDHNRFYYADSLESIQFVGKAAGNIPLNWMVHQQYTGLNDKSGKEVYDGDILRIKYFVGDFAWEWMTDEEVKENSEMHGKEYTVIVTNSLIDGVNMQLQGKHEAGLISFPLSYIKSGVVVGNIYENPELIKTEI